jgi:hypothetical protein
MIEPEAILLELHTTFPTAALTAGPVEAPRLAVSKRQGAERRAFQAELTLKYCQGQARPAETLFGWGRHPVAVGLAEKCTGIICLGAQSAFAGSQRWAERHPAVTAVLRHVAASPAQQAPSVRTALAYTRLPAKDALQQLRERGVAEDQLPSPSAMAQSWKRMGYRLRKVVKAKPQKKFRKPMSFSPLSRRKIDRRNPTRSTGCVGTAKPQSSGVIFPVAGRHAALLKPLLTPWGARQSLFPAASWTRIPATCTVPWAVPIKPAMAAWIPCRRGGTGLVRQNSRVLHSFRSQWITARTAMGYGPSASTGGWR